MGSNNTQEPFTPIPDPNHSNGYSNRSTIAFRLLFHASRVGAFIGKSGAGIKWLQQVTAAKIRVENGPTDCPERVILVLVKLDGEVLKPQEVLLKVFERVLDVAAETEEIDVGDRVVSCRLLANNGQAGSVIGKGGKVVEKIRIDTGCRIRVLTDKLPACTRPSDEIIEIQGNVSSVKKALIAVAGRLQDCPPADRTNKMGTRPYEVVRHETSAVPQEGLTDMNMDSHLQRISALSTSSIIRSNGNASEVHPLSAEANRVSALDLKPLQQEITFRIICSNHRVGAVIGKSGSIVRALQEETGATISVGPSLAESNDRLITVTALENPESRYSPAQKAVVLVFSKSVEAGAEKVLDSESINESSVTAKLVVPSNQVGCLLGKAGAIVSEMRKTTGTSIRIIGNGQVPMCASDYDQVVQISGEFSNVQDALYEATSRLRENLFVRTKNSGGTRPYGRMRNSNPLGDQPVVGVSPSLSIHSLSQSIDHLNLSGNLDRSSSIGFWAPKIGSAINPRGIDDVDRRLTPHQGGLDIVSRSKTAIVTNTTLEIMVPGDIIGSVYGENGSNLAQLRQISGANVMVHEPRPGTSEMTIVISGTPDETQAAQSLLQAFILNGSS